MNAQKLGLALALALTWSAAVSASQSADRPVAEWVLRLGGSVVLEGGHDPIWDVAALPAGEFRLRAVNLVGVVTEPRELARLGELPHLKELYLSGRFWHNVPARQCAESLRPLQALTNLEKLFISLPVQTDIPIEDDGISYLAGMQNLRELGLDRLKVTGKTLGPLKQLRFLDLSYT